MGKDISYLNKTNIVAGRLENLVPEIYELKNVIENAEGWHDDESTFDHTLKVMQALEKIFLTVSGRINGKLKKTLNQKIDSNTRKILLKTSAVLHDIAKKETITKDINGFTECPGHAELGARKARKILDRFNLSEREKQFVCDIIANHMHFHFIIAPDNLNFQKEFVAIKNKFLDYIYPELILLGYADTVDTGMRKTNPKEFRHRIDFYKREIEKLS